MFGVLFSWRCSSVLISREEGKRFASCPCCSACEARGTLPIASSAHSLFLHPPPPRSRFPEVLPFLSTHRSRNCRATSSFDALPMFSFSSFLYGSSLAIFSATAFFPRLSIGFLQCTLPPPASLLPVFCSAPLLGNRRAGSVHRLLSLFPFLFLSLVSLREGALARSIQRCFLRQLLAPTV